MDPRGRVRDKELGLFIFILLARLVTVLVRAKMLLLAPTPAALARFGHHPYRHASKAAILLVKSFDLFKSFNFRIQCLNFLQELNFVSLSVYIDPFEVLRQLDALVIWHIYILVKEVFHLLLLLSTPAGNSLLVCLMLLHMVCSPPLL